jgi:hypothetical protein
MKNLNPFRFTAAVVTLAAILFTTSHGLGQTTRTWNGASLTTSNWSDGDNWVGGVAPTQLGISCSGDPLIFTGITLLNMHVDYNDPSSFGLITFDSDAGAFVLNGSSRIVSSGKSNNWIVQLGGATNGGTGGGIILASGATLGGMGTVGGATTIQGGGILFPGTSPETLTFAGNLRLADEAVLLFESGDLVDVGGQLTLNETWTLPLEPGLGWVEGGTTLFNYNTIATSLALARSQYHQQQRRFRHLYVDRYGQFHRLERLERHPRTQHRSASGAGIVGRGISPPHAAMSWAAGRTPSSLDVQ